LTVNGGATQTAHQRQPFGRLPARSGDRDGVVEAVSRDLGAPEHRERLAPSFFATNSGAGHARLVWL